MNNKAMLSFVLLTVATGLWPAEALGAEQLPPRALARIGDHRFYHGPGVTGVALSPDGRRIASAASYPLADKERDAYSRTIVLWDALTGERLREMHGPHTEIHLLAFSPDGKRLAAAYPIADQKHGAAVFAVETGKLLRRLEEFKSWASFVQFSADGKQLQVSEFLGPVSAWDVATGKQLHRWNAPSRTLPDGDKKTVCGVGGMLSPDGKVVVWEMGNKDRSDIWEAVGLRVHEAATDKLLYQKKFKHNGPLTCLSFSPDSKRFAAAGDKFTVWETATGKELAACDVSKTEVAFPGPDVERIALPEIYRFALAPDGQRAAILERSFWLRWWDLKTGEMSRKLWPGCVCVNAYLLSEPQVFSADGKTLLGATDTTLRLFDTASGKERAAPGHHAPITPRFSADGHTLFTSCEERRCSWDVSGKGPTFLKHEPRNVWETDAVAHSADDRLFLDGPANRLCIRETATGRVLHELKDAGRLSFCQFSPDASRVLLWYDGKEKLPKKVRLYEVKTGKASNAIKAVALVGEPIFSPNGRFVAWADTTNAVHLHDVVTGTAARTLRSLRPFTASKCDDAHLLFSPDGERVIVTAYIYRKPDIEEEYTALPTCVFQVSSGREIARFYVNPKKASKAALFACAACSLDGRLLAVSEKYSGKVRLIEIASGKVRAEFVGHRQGVHGLAFAPDGKTLASGGEDNVVFLWDVTGAKTLPDKPENLAGWWNDLASEDGKRAANALACLLRKPEVSVTFLQQQLHPAEAVDEKRLARLLANLDGDDFKTREEASRELARLGGLAEAALLRALTNRPSLEARRRIKDLLDKLPAPLPPETLRALRAIEVLEHVGTPAAQRFLEALAKAAPEARPTREAKGALQRLAKRR